MSNTINVLLKNLKESTEISKKIYKKYSSKIIPINFALTIIFEIFNRFGLLTYLLWRALTGVISVGGFSGLYSAAGNLLSSLQGVAQITRSFYENDLYIQKFRKFYNYSVEPLIESSLNLSLGSMDDYTIRFDNVSSQYNFEHKYVLNGINFECKKGQKIAIVGHNGAGKTTLINLLLKLYDPVRGTISINGVDINEYNYESYIQNFNVIPQDFNIFAFSIAENVVQDLVSDSDLKHILNALYTVGLNDKIEGMDKGLNTMLTKEFDQNGVVFQVARCKNWLYQDYSYMINLF